MKRVYRSTILLTVATVLACISLAYATPDKKAYDFRGKVEAVDEKAGTLRVNGEEVKGWMEAMTMDYKVDDPMVLHEVKAGDRIMATVYDGDMVLHNVHVMHGGSKSKM